MAVKKEQRNILKYEKQIMPTGGVPKFVPLVFERSWNWGIEADKFLDEMLKKLVDVKGRSNEHEFRNRWRRHFSMLLLQKCNRSVLLKRLTRLSCGRVVDCF